MTFTYTPNIPQPTDFPSNSQSQILQNFQYLCPSSASTTGLTKDHNMTLINSGLGDGQHRQVTIKANQATPGFVNGVSVLYANTANGQSQLFFNNGAIDSQLTTAVAGAPGITVGPPYQAVTYLPGGMLIQFGNTTAATVTFPIAFKAGTLPSVSFSVTSTASNQFPIISITNSTFTRGAIGGGGIMFWIAIGQAT